jgi:hypothetical protein
MLLISQIRDDERGGVVVVAREGSEAYAVRGAGSVYELATDAIRSGTTLTARIAGLGLGRAIDLEAAYEEGRLLPPITHPDPAHMFVTGTGLTHLGSASARDAMHALPEEEANQTDSAKMFRMGIEGGKPPAGAVGVQPEWFYKGNGHSVVAPGALLISPDFALDGGEEAEIAGIYLVAASGTPFRVGFSLANEFSDHVTERANYLYLAHSKLRQCSFGPEIFVGELPREIAGTARILRQGRAIWEKPFLSGEANMSHAIANLEHHHFKYDLFRSPGDVHVHMFGAATLSFADGVKTKRGDVFEIEAPQFGLPLRNTLEKAADTTSGNPVAVEML